MCIRDRSEPLCWFAGFVSGGPSAEVRPLGYRYSHDRLLGAEPPGAACGRLRAMRVYLGSDHAGFELKNHLVGWLLDNGHEPVDCGPSNYVDDDDYPPYVIDTAVR